MIEGGLKKDDIIYEQPLLLTDDLEFGIFNILKQSDIDCHNVQKSINFLDPENLGSYWMFHNSSLELFQVHNIILVLVGNFEHLCHGFSKVNLMFISLPNLDEDSHDLIQLVQGDDLVAICIKEVEDPDKIVLELAVREQIEDDEHVCHGYFPILVRHSHGQLVNLFFRSAGEGNGECFDEVSLFHFTIRVLVHQHIKILFHQLHCGKSGVFCQILKVPGLDPLPGLCVAHGADDADGGHLYKLLTV